MRNPIPLALPAMTVAACLGASPALAHPGHDGTDNPIILAAIQAHGSVAAATLPAPKVTIEEKDGQRVITANGIPDHKPGEFPNRGNPNAIKAQTYVYRMPLHPKAAEKDTPLVRQPFGVALNGVPFDPGTAEYWKNDPASGWRIEAIAPGVHLGLDAQEAHVQPNGAYHYHGLAPALVEKNGGADGKAGKTMTLIGWAADGFPIYGSYAYSDPKDPKSPIKKMAPSWHLKKGERPAGTPGGKYDGKYTQDFEFAAGSGDLDACNGREGVTPEFPGGTYYYVVTESFPFIPRAFHGTPDKSFERRGPGGRPGGRGGRPGGGPPGGRRPGDGPPEGGPREGRPEERPEGPGPR